MERQNEFTGQPTQHPEQRSPMKAQAVAGQVLQNCSETEGTHLQPQLPVREEMTLPSLYAQDREDHLCRRVRYYPWRRKSGPPPAWVPSPDHQPDSAQEHSFPGVATASH